MNDLEEKAMEVVNELLQNEELPINRVKSIHLNWETISGDYLPVLHCEFYPERGVGEWMTDFMKS
jgi:hypothetical protein